MSDYQLIVIGSGPGGYVAAIRGAQKGLKVAVIEEKQAGGTCLNRGCIPTKALLHTSGLYAASQREFDTLGLTPGSPDYNWQKIHQRKLDIILKNRSGIEYLFKANGVDFLRGHGCLLPNHRAKWTAADTGKETVLTGDHILLATGSVPALPPIPGLDLPGVITSDHLLADIPPATRSIAMIGAGVIGVEFAQFFNDLGCDVTLIDVLPKILGRMDEELSSTLASLLKRRSVKIKTSTVVTSVEKASESDGLTLKLKDSKEKESELTVDTVLVATGRRPYLEGLFGEGLTCDLNRQMIQVNDHFETSIPGVYAIGDVIGGLQLAHQAEVQGQAVIAYLMGEEPQTRTDLVPACVYTAPELASIGLTEQEAQEKEMAVTVGKYLMNGNSKMIIEGLDRGFIKLIFEKETEKLLGVHLICGRASDLISEFATAIAKGLTRRDLLSGMRPHPTFCEGITEALEAPEGLSIHSVPSKRP